MPKYQINATQSPRMVVFKEVERDTKCCCIDNAQNGLSPHIGECLFEDKSNFGEKGHSRAALLSGKKSLLTNMHYI